MKTFQILEFLEDSSKIPIKDPRTPTPIELKFIATGDVPSESDLLIFTAIDNVSATINSISKTGERKFTVHTTLEESFGGMFGTSVSEACDINDPVLSFSLNELNQIKSLEGQRGLYIQIANHFIPEKKEFLTDLLLPAVIIYESLDHIESHNFNLFDLKTTTVDNQNLSRVALINIAEFKSLFQSDSETSISFYVALDDTLDHLPINKGEFAVIEEQSDLTSLPPTSDSKSIESITILDIPDYCHSTIEQAGFSQEQIAKYELIRSLFRSLTMGSYLSSTETVKILGYPDPVQYCVTLDAIDLHPETTSDQWMLLLQIPGDFAGNDHIDGILYFMIHKDDLANGRFDRAKLVIQGT